MTASLTHKTLSELRAISDDLVSDRTQLVRLKWAATDRGDRREVKRLLSAMDRNQVKLDAVGDRIRFHRRLRLATSVAGALGKALGASMSAC